MDEKHKKKMLAPIIITAAVLMMLMAAAVVLIARASGVNSTNILFLIPLIALGVGMIRTLKGRIEEIRSGEEDDLSNY